MRLRVATCLTLPEPDPDAAPLAAALAAAGVDATLVPWEDDAAWAAPAPTLLRSTWNYSLAVERFVAWTAAVAATAPLWNDAEIVRGNCHKGYLLDLAARGVPTVPTELVARGAGEAELIARVVKRGWGRIVIKPAVGAGSLGARVFAEHERAAAADHLATWAARGDVLLQPYQRSIEDHGERSLVFIDGEVTHAIRKSPRFAGDDERITGPHPIGDDERAVAMAALAPFAARVLYGRVDLARADDGTPQVMELELIEPSLFFARHPPALDRFVAGLVRRLRAAG
jgi:glutathione synthase/RimK-type ligase-like ATP-grasp enzyme